MASTLLQHTLVDTYLRCGQCLRCIPTHEWWWCASGASAMHAAYAAVGAALTCARLDSSPAWLTTCANTSCSSRGSASVYGTSPRASPSTPSSRPPASAPPDRARGGGGSSMPSVRCEVGRARTDGGGGPHGHALWQQLARRRAPLHSHQRACVAEATGSARMGPVTGERA
jgi:hypothetical protein